MKNSWKALLAAGYCFFLTFPLPHACAEEAPMAVDADEANFDGKKFTLSGNVSLEHDLGRISTQKAVLAPEQEDKKFRLRSLFMFGNVHISLKDGGQLSCAKASLDYKALTGSFQGDPVQEYVVYMENVRDKANPSLRIPMVLKSRQMNVLIAQAPKSHISHLEAQDNVTIDYNHDFIAQSDFASYDKDRLDSGEKNSGMTGLISLRSASPQGLCRVTNRNGDLINASQICIDTVKRQICFAYPKGVIYSNRTAENTERIDFTGDTLTWDARNQVITLRDHVQLNQKGLGQLTTDKEITIYQNTVNGKSQLSSIESTGTTVLTRLEENKKVEHHLICHGKMVVDHVKLEVHMDSPAGPDGSVSENDQVFFDDPMGEIHADRLKLQYEIADKGMVPKKLTLEGNVKMLNSYAAASDQSSSLVQYALADIVEYYPQTKEAVFSTRSGGRRVLFYDKVNDLQVSAPGLKIKRNEVTKKDSVKGIGDVRFSFIEHEFEQLRRRFSLDKIKEKDKNEHQ